MANGFIEVSPSLSQVAPGPHDTLQLEHQLSSLPLSASCTDLSLDHDLRDGSERVGSPGISFCRKTRSKNSSTDGPTAKSKAEGVLYISNSSIQSCAPDSSTLDARVGSSKLTSDPSGSANVGIRGADSDASRKSPPNRKEPSRERLRRSISGSISNIRRRSWAAVAPARSPSPGAQRRLTEQIPREASSRRTSSRLRTNQPSAQRRNRASRPLGFFERHSTGSVSPDKDGGEEARCALSISKSTSTDTLPSTSGNKSETEVPAVPCTPSREVLSGIGTESPRRRDVLWNAFRSLDGEFHKFHSRATATKTSVLRTALLPFLRTYAAHPSTSNLRPEDLDRRAVVLNKWWTGLLEMLNGRHGESVSGNDRPAVLEATTALMIRPEWTVPPLRHDKTSKNSLKSRSTTSIGSCMSDFLTDSVHHNVRNMFTQNLLAQMAYVVDKMSARSVPASVVSFCGKATAYAFFYCEGVAEILVRLWSVSSRHLRKIIPLDMERELTKNIDMEKILSAFPPCIHALGFKALRPMMKHLRARPHVPVAMSYIPWYNKWVSKWVGLETDLFYVFVKFYIDLASRCLSDDIEARMAAPAWAIVHAQLLVVLERTLQRSGANFSSDQQRALPVTFDGILGQADAAAATLPLPPANQYRSMAENRLIMLIRDSLSTLNLMDDRAQRLFAHSVSSLMQTAACGISVFDHQACFTLCDFLEEGFPILHRYYLGSCLPDSIIKWPFWLLVFKRFLESQNSMTEIRLFALIYSMWSIIASNSEWRRDFCLGWLLSKEVFQRRFNHWCPMVRAFYMRLCIWRIARLDEDDPVGGSINCEILNTLKLRLDEVWAIYRHLEESMVHQTGCSLSTAPCSPAPKRCLKILKDDARPASSGIFLSLDGSFSSDPKIKLSPPDRSNRVMKRSSFSDEQPLIGKSFGALLKDVLSRRPFCKRSRSEERAENSDTAPNMREGASYGGATSSASPVTHVDRPHGVLSFKFSLEWLDETDSLFGQETQLLPPQMPLPTLLRQETRSANCPSPDTTILASDACKNTGRALAEWRASVTECRDFFQKRKAEGVPSQRLVETPMLNVGPFRKI